MRTRQCVRERGKERETFDTIVKETDPIKQNRVREMEEEQQQESQSRRG